MVVVSAPMNAATVIAPWKLPLARVALMTWFESLAEATACQISAVPAWALARRRSVQVSPPPVTALNDWPPAAFGPSEPMNASSSSPGWRWSAPVRDVRARRALAGRDRLVEREPGAEPVVTVSGCDGPLSFPAASRR